MASSVVWGALNITVEADSKWVLSLVGDTCMLDMLVTLALLFLCLCVCVRRVVSGYVGVCVWVCGCVGVWVCGCFCL